MSQNPFMADAAIAARITDLDARIGAELRANVAARLLAHAHDPAANLGGVLLAADADALTSAYGLTSEQLMLLTRKLAEGMARPPISNFFVGAVSREEASGNLIYGGNLEFPGAAIGFTVHGEGYLAARAFSRGVRLDRIALGEAHPCGHCRQFLSEFAWASSLILIDPLGHRLTLSQLFPWPFDPAYLGDVGAVPGLANWPDLTLTAADPLAGPLVEAVARAHAPYSKAPAAVALQLKDGKRVTGASIESVAFNPSLGPLQTALIDLFAHGYDLSDIVGASLAVTRRGTVDHEAATRALLATVAPGVPLNVLDWR